MLWFNLTQHFMKNYFESNKILWDKRAALHVDSDFYDMKSFREGASSLKPIEMDLLGDIKGKSILHLQCHFGQDSLSMARMGAKVTGLDISETAIEQARNINEELGLDATFVCANVLDTNAVIKEEFDIVFLSYGAICWLPDLQPWAEIIASRLKAGGQLIMAEFHPVLYMYDWDSNDIAYHYFNDGKPYVEVEENSYAATDKEINAVEYFWVHPLSDIIQQLIRAGLTINTFKEFDYSPYHCFSNLEERAPGEYTYNLTKYRFPHVFSIKATK